MQGVRVPSLVREIKSHVPCSTAKKKFVFKEMNGEGNGNPLQHTCLGNPMDRGVW